VPPPLLPPHLVALVHVVLVDEHLHPLLDLTTITPSTVNYCCCCCTLSFIKLSQNLTATASTEGVLRWRTAPVYRAIHPDPGVVNHGGHCQSLLPLTNFTRQLPLVHAKCEVHNGTKIKCTPFFNQITKRSSATLLAWLLVEK
jgi:hypothetical protein